MPSPAPEKGPRCAARWPHHCAIWSCRWDLPDQLLDWALCQSRELRGTEGQSWNVINNVNEVFYLSDIHLQLFRPTERCPSVVKGNPPRTQISILLLNFYHLFPYSIFTKLQRNTISLVSSFSLTWAHLRRGQTAASIEALSIYPFYSFLFLIMRTM